MIRVIGDVGVRIQHGIEYAALGISRGSSQTVIYVRCLTVFGT